MDAFGPRPALDEMAERLAAAGYVVLLPDLFYRAGAYGPFDAKTAFNDEAKRTQLMSLINGTTQEMTASDGAAFLDALARHGATGKIGTVGYCMGGGRALTAAATYPDRIAAAARRRARIDPVRRTHIRAKELEAVKAVWPDAQTMGEYLAAVYTARGQLDMARSEIAVFPHRSFFNLASYRLTYESYMREEDLARHLELLKAAGMPDWPFGFQGRADDQVTGADLKKLVTDRTWSGNSPVGDEKNAPFMLQIDHENRVAYRSLNTFLTGVVRINGDQVCMRFDGYRRNVCFAAISTRARVPAPNAALGIGAIFPQTINA